MIDFLSDCSKNPLRIGYDPGCGGLHELSDSNGKPNADYARLNHPATYPGPNGAEYYEYSSGEYLTIKLSQMAYIHGISIQGSPNNTRYYLKSFELWYKTVVNNLDISKASSIVADNYLEGGLEPMPKVSVSLLLS